MAGGVVAISRFLPTKTKDMYMRVRFKLATLFRPRIIEPLERKISLGNAVRVVGFEALKVIDSARQGVGGSF